MVNPTISYYEKWLGGDGCLVMPGVQFIQSAERDKVQPGYPTAFDLYLWHDNERIVISYSGSIADYVETLRTKLTTGQSVADVKELLSKVFECDIGHNVKFIFDQLPTEVVIDNVKTLTKTDYQDFETFFKTQHPSATDVSWLPEYFEEMVAENLCVAVYEGGKIVCCTDAPMMPYLENQVQESGVNTLPAYRKKGYAVIVCGQMITNVLANGKVPQWSTTIDNVGSGRLAERVGFKKLADVLTITGYERD